MRLIDADEIVKDDHQHYEYMSDTFYVTVADIEDAPTIDAVPVVHARWIYGEDDYDDSTYYCSACREPWTLIAGTPQENNMRYCPNCGAKMDGGTE